MYQKITDGFVDMNRQKILENKKLQKQNSVPPMSYIMCPKCDNPDIEKCDCPGGTNNYYCRLCQFKYIHHHHSAPKTDGTKMTKNIDKGTLAKVIRR